MSEQNEVRMWRGALIPALILAALSLIMGTIFRAAPGFWGALLASFTVIIFFSVHLLISKLSRNLDPMATMALAMLSYFAKLSLIGSLLLLVTKTTSPESVDRATFAGATIAITAAWLAGEIRAFLKLRITLPLPQTKAGD